MKYLVVVKTLSGGTDEKTITSYENDETLLRKFHEAFNVIGGGPTKIRAMILSDDFGIEKSEVWTQAAT